MALLLKLPCATGSRQSNIAAAKSEVVISHLIDYIELKFQRLHQYIWGLETHFCQSQIPAKNDYTFCYINI